jgi:Fe-S-cluster containining protein
MDRNILKHQLNQLLENYRNLCRYCDGFFSIILEKYPAEMKCRKGCSTCCELESVTQIEASVIADYLTTQNPVIEPGNSGSCIFLRNGLCQIYPVRPIICRTHGLILYDSEAQNLLSTCSLNFPQTDLNQFEIEDALDSLKITENLIRLNLAFDKINGKREPEIERIPLTEICIVRVQ